MANSFGGCPQPRNLHYSDGLLEYQELKSALTGGRHIFATVKVDDCNPALVGATITAGFYIDDWQVTNNGESVHQQV
jgi:hypothetical protein